VRKKPKALVNLKAGAFTVKKGGMLYD